MLQYQRVAKSLKSHRNADITKAMHLLRANVDLNYIRDFLGHVNIETTEVYAKADAEMKRKALEKANMDMPLENQTSWQKNENLMSWLQSLN